LDTNTIYGTETKHYFIQEHGIAYNFQTTTWEDYGTYGAREEDGIATPSFVEQTGDSVVLLDKNRYELGKFTDPYYAWTYYG